MKRLLIIGIALISIVNEALIVVYTLVSFVLPGLYNESGQRLKCRWIFKAVWVVHSGLINKLFKSE